MFSLEKIIQDVLNEENVAGGEGSAFGPNGGGNSQFSGDSLYNPGSAQIPYSVYGKGRVMTRKGLSKKRKKRKKRRKK